MKYDFYSIIERGGTDAIAVDSALYQYPGVKLKKGFDIIPMWVADMNFPVVPTIQNEIAKRIAHPAFGYFAPAADYFNSIIRWQETRNDTRGLTREQIGYENSVLGGVVNALNIFCSRGDHILIHSPTYVGFTACAENNGYTLVLSPLMRDDRNIWRMDFEDMEKKIIDKRIHTAIFCSPHNPAGRVWEKWEIEKAMELFQKHDVFVISDEIWSDIILKGYKHIPTQSVSEDARQRTVALYAPTKTFNLAGLVGGYHVAYNQRIMDRLRRESSLTHYNGMNLLTMYALIGAYSDEGYEWVNELCEILTLNADYACRYIQDHFAGIDVVPPQGTYMIFLDCSRWCEIYGKSIDELLMAGAQVVVCWQDGRAFHGPCHIRMNLALPFSRIQEAMERLDKYVFNI